MLTIAHVVDFHKRYPGDTLTYFTRVTVQATVTNLTVRISLPENIVPNAYQATASDGTPFPNLEVGEDGLFMAWAVSGEPTAGMVYEYQTVLRVAPTAENLVLLSEAVATFDRPPDSETDAETESDKRVRIGETAVVNVFAKGSYLQHMPALYDSDEFMGRFLMLFESFWKPIETQIDHLPYYFDCRMTPMDVLPILASWLSLEFSAGWTDEQKRLLVCAIIRIYRKRGTRWGMSKFLEIYTGVVPDIVEHIGRNFTIGPQARMGKSLALGRGNQPHTFTVTMHLPAIKEPNEERRKRFEAERLRMIEQIIEFEKPAHTAYQLNLVTAQG